MRGVSVCLNSFEQSSSSSSRVPLPPIIISQKKVVVGGEEMATNCHFWLPKKKRYCAVTPLPNSSFCGNHTSRSEGRWIPCPIDPSHSVLEGNLQTHLKRCPLLKYNQSLSLLPFYSKGINAGFDSNSISLDVITSEMKRRAVHSMTIHELRHLLTKIKSLHASICNHIPQSYKIPDACGAWINGEVDRYK